MKGGYINIDVSGLDVTLEEQTISGIYKKILDAKKANKPIFLYNAVNGGLGKISPIGVFSKSVDSNRIRCVASNMVFDINIEDDVGISNL